MIEELLKVNKVYKSFGGTRALESFCLSVKPNEIVGLIGPNGAGKTTLFNTITGFIHPEKGTILFNGRNIVCYPPHKVASLGIARTFQKLRFIYNMSVIENILLAFRDQPGERLGNIFFEWKVCKKRELVNIDKAASLLEKVGLIDKINSNPRSLSFGEQKLLSLIICIVSNPRLLLLDEPIAGISNRYMELILQIILNLPREGKTIILIEHNFDAISNICDRIVFMNVGTNLYEGTAQEVKGNQEIIKTYFA